MRPSIALLVLFATPLFGQRASASVVFSCDFEWGADWNCSQGDTAPVANGWDGVQCFNRGGDFEAAYVNAAGAKQGMRGFIQYWDATPSQGAAQDIWLISTSISFPLDYYIGYWFKIDANWDWGDVTSLKVIKTNFADNSNTSWDINWTSSANYPNPSEYYVVDGSNWTGAANCGQTINTDEMIRQGMGCWNHIADGQWHHFIWHMNHAAGTLSLWIDGSDALQMQLITPPFGSPFSDGVNGLERWNFGGNISDGGGGYAEMYTAYDDIIIATTRAEVESFLGVGQPDTTAPNMSNPQPSGQLLCTDE